MFTTKLLGSDTVAEGTRRFMFEKPTGFSYLAGQSIDLVLMSPPETDAEGNMRAFSISATPEDGQLAVTTRMRNTAFKRVLGKMQAGGELSFDGPFGSFTLHENVKRPAVFLAGGIGITPFYSILKDATERKLPHILTLFYSNRRPEDSAFLDELTKLAEKNPRFTFVPTMTDMSKSSRTWDGKRGYIDAEMIAQYVDASRMPIYYLAGPPAMVAALRAVLNQSGVSNDDIRTEEFSGY